jgi:hypothetical protein
MVEIDQIRDRNTWSGLPDGSGPSSVRDMIWPEKHVV